MVDFRSDNVKGAAPEILAALAEANTGTAAPYGDDALTARLQDRFREVFETDCAVFPVATGTAANVLGLSVMTPSYGAIYCHKDSHINVDECGAPELYSGGAKLVALPGADAKLSAAQLAEVLAEGGAGVVHHVQPAAISLTQASEAGTVYRVEEVAAIAEVARAHGLGLQMDGARFANALVTLGCSPAEATWKAGVDVLAFGGTKNGCFCAEAVVVFRPELAATLPYRRKRGGHLFSKLRFLSAQLEAYLKDDLWLRLARHANGRARDLAEGLAALPGVEILHPVEANEIFARLPQGLAERLRGQGFTFYDWAAAGPGAVRLITAFDSEPEEVATFLAAARAGLGVEAVAEPEAEPA
ncbi:MAG: low specificity L-threonine aldolase [Kiloniellales bacterium]|nr:low specificity L-threonine aldolase [Kiloniellales bacterium]